jgi:predicted ArsR family transcriptional regulator
MTDDADKGRGRPREYRKEDVLRALRDLDDGSGVRTGEVADSVGCSTRTALRRLTSLEEDSLVTSTAVTDRMKLWFANAE